MEVLVLWGWMVRVVGLGRGRVWFGQGVAMGC